MENQLKKLMLGLVGYAVQRDIPAELLLRSANVSMEEMLDLDSALSSKQVSDIWLNAVHLSKDELFGLHFGESLQLAALGIVGEIIKTSETVGDALVMASGISHLITESIRIEVVREGSFFSVLFQPVSNHWQNETVTVQMLDLLVVFVIHELNGLMLKKIRPISVSYGKKLVRPEEYERVLRCRPESGAEQTVLTFDNAFWDEKIITSNYQHQKLLLEQAGFRQNSSATYRLADQISSFLISNSYTGMATLEDVASNFNISSRTLQRRLREENTSFQQLTDEVRKTLAVAYLRDGSYQGKEISYMLGYNELSAFTRTFKRWTGQTPAAYQRNFLTSKMNIGT